jgi:hypothetical protein
VWLNSFKDTEGMMSSWMHLLQQFHFIIVDRVGKDHGNADGLSRVLMSPCEQCSRPDCKPLKPQSQTNRLTPIQLAAQWTWIYFRSRQEKIGVLCWIMTCISVSQTADALITDLQKEDNLCKTFVSWIRTNSFPPWTEVKNMSPDIRLLWDHRNNLFLDEAGVVWHRRSGQVEGNQLLVPKPGRKDKFVTYHQSALVVI